MKLSIGMVSTRFAGLDGVSRETAKWTEVLEEMGHGCYWLAGELDRPPPAAACMCLKRTFNRISTD